MQNDRNKENMLKYFKEKKREEENPGYIPRTWNIITLDFWLGRLEAVGNI